MKEQCSYMRFYREPLAWCLAVKGLSNPLHLGRKCGSILWAPNMLNDRILRMPGQMIDSEYRKRRPSPTIGKYRLPFLGGGQLNIVR